MEEQATQHETDAHFEKLKDVIDKSNLIQLKALLQPEVLKQYHLTEASKEIKDAKEKLVDLERQKREFTNSLKSYFINVKLWDLLTSRYAAVFIQAEYLFLQKLNAKTKAKKTFDKEKQQLYIQQNTICNVMYKFLSQSIPDFTEIYPSLTANELEAKQRENPDLFKDYKNEKGELFNEHWEFKPRKSGGSEWVLSAQGKQHKSTNSEFNVRRTCHWNATDTNSKTTKLGNIDTLREELYCHYYKFWNINIDARCIPNKRCQTNCVFGYLGKEGLKRLSQHLPIETCPEIYPVRTYANHEQLSESLTSLDQAISSINYLILDSGKSPVSKPDGSLNLEKMATQLESSLNINIYLLDATTACSDVSIEWSSDEIVRLDTSPKKYGETIFLYVFRSAAGIQFVEPIVFINLKHDSYNPLPLIKILPNDSTIVTNLEKDLPECSIHSREVTPVSSPVLPEKPLPSTPPSISQSSPILPVETLTHGTTTTAYYNINDIGEKLPIVEVGVNRDTFLLGNEYNLGEEKYRNLYQVEFPFNLMARLSGNVLEGTVSLSWVKLPDVASQQDTVSSQTGGGISIYDCLSKISKVNSTPFYSILENSSY